MKTTKLLILIFLMLGLSLSSFSQDFSLTKRQYRKGYYFQKNERIQKKKQAKADNIANIKIKPLSKINKNIKEAEPLIIEPTIDESLIASTNNNVLNYNDVVKDSPEKTTQLKTAKKIFLAKRINKVFNKMGFNDTPVNKYLEKKIALNSNSLNVGETDPVSAPLSTAGLVLGIVGFFVFGFILGLLSIIFSAISLGKIAKNPGKYKGKGKAIAGLILGLIDLIGWVAIMVILFAA